MKHFSHSMLVLKIRLIPKLKIKIKSNQINNDQLLSSKIMNFFNLKYFSFSFSHNIVKYCSSKIITWSKWPTFTIGSAWFSFRWGLLYIRIMCLIFKRRTTQGKMKRNQIKGPFGLKGKGGGVEGSRVELAESRLVSDHIYSTPLPSPSI